MVGNDCQKREAQFSLGREGSGDKMILYVF